MLEQQAREADEKRVQEALESVKKLLHPMVLVDAETFLSSGKLLSHEELRDAGKLVFPILSSVFGSSKTS